MPIQYRKVIDIGKDRYEWLESHPDHLLPMAVRSLIDDWMSKVKEKA